MGRRWLALFALLTLVAAMAWGARGAFGTRPVFSVLTSVRPSLEDTLPDGSPFSPSTQSFLRGKHWLESVTEAAIRVDIDRAAHIRLRGAEGDEFAVKGLPIDQLVPRLFYPPARPPDAFDAYNLMMAEFSRNGLSVPRGADRDAATRFVTTLDGEAPWSLAGNYDFSPNPRLRPLRFSIVNNCLQAGLWEFSAVDRAGEIYHAWFDFPEAEYVHLVAQTNNVPPEFVRSALVWKTDPAPIALDRLRKPLEELGTVAAAVLAEQGEAVGYSTQDSRQKVAKGYAKAGEPGSLRPVGARSDLTVGLAYLTEFAPPGKYSLARNKCFDLRFLALPKNATVRRVEPRTRYHADPAQSATALRDMEYIELVLHLEEYDIVIGNLPLELLVPQEDFALNGFGVGILEPAGFAERRQILFESGPAPSYAYLVRKTGEVPMAVNSHDFGIEQLFIRAHSWDSEPWWELTISSFERIIDVIKYRIEMPEPLRAKARETADRYIAPLYLTYRDDNLR